MLEVKLHSSFGSIDILQTAINNISRKECQVLTTQQVAGDMYIPRNFRYNSRFCLYTESSQIQYAQRLDLSAVNIVIRQILKRKRMALH